jgi:hypothetical protein
MSQAAETYSAATLAFAAITDEAWQHAVRFFVRDLEAVPAQQR